VPLGIRPCKTEAEVQVQLQKSLDLHRKAMANSTLLKKLVGAIRRIMGYYASHFPSLVSVSVGNTENLILGDMTLVMV
jgi:hypothetical protein